MGFDVVTPETNLVYVDPRPVGFDATSFAGALADRGVEISTIGPRNRMCTHLDVTADDITTALDAVRAVIG